MGLGGTNYGSGKKASFEERIESVRKNTPNGSHSTVHTSEKDGVAMIAFWFSDNVDVFALLSELTSMLQSDGDISIQEVNQQKDNTSISLVYGDGKHSIEIVVDRYGGGRISFFADAAFSSRDEDVIVHMYEYCCNVDSQAADKGTSDPQAASVISKLESLGVEVFTPNKVANSQMDAKEDVWDQIAGYDQIKQDIKDTIILSIKYPEKYREIARKTRKKWCSRNRLIFSYSSPLPRSILFEGPPGTGKTSIARLIAQESNVILVHIPLESVMSKWYGESERRLNSILQLCNKIDNCVIFIDEIDSLATSRDSDNMHEETRRLLSTLLRFLEGFDNSNMNKDEVNTKRSILICATNRKKDLDSALLSRFDLQLHFGLPDVEARAKIFGRYAKQLNEEQLRKLAELSEGMSGRDIRDSCEIAERSWVSKCIREKKAVSVPPMKQYEEAVKRRVDETKSHMGVSGTAFGLGF
ncbi:ATPase [Blastocystis sp. ATCC 50177/Nand II]|uniref:ATPase n=1 Tax=Blastocystis sp. subtype 1 (strain ATCC 50177 / NandII) TaxID=478820 RepID=A0A196SLQ6_BLAHN|nr:ATPase [Blastocystis sp. ATCC 50177/Nand II]